MILDTGAHRFYNNAAGAAALGGASTIFMAAVDGRSNGTFPLSADLPLLLFILVFLKNSLMDKCMYLEIFH
jgi:hypothetical protein